MISLYINTKVLAAGGGGHKDSQAQVCGEYLLPCRCPPTAALLHAAATTRPFQPQVQVAENEWLIEGGNRVFFFSPS